MNKLKWTIIAALLATSAACQRHEASAPQATQHAADPARNDTGHEHGGGISITNYSGVTELFVEFPVLVKNEEAVFAAHLTRLADFKAVAEGTLTVILIGNGQPEESAETQVSQTPGIFRVTLKPQHAGKRRLVFQLSGPGLSATHNGGEVEIHGNRQAAMAAAVSAADEGIRFSKEQQWGIEFANAAAIERDIRESVPVLATIRPRASGEAQLSAPTAGLLRAGPGGFPQVGMKVAAGQVLAFLAPRLGGETDIATLNLAVQRALIESQQARQERDRLEGLLAVEAIPAKRVVDARRKEELAQAELKAAEQRAATSQGGGGGIALRSPIAGTVVAVSAIPGAAVIEGQMIIHVADLGRLWLEAHVPESAAARIKQPAGVFFRLDGAADTTVLQVGSNAQLIAFGGMVDTTTRTLPAIFEFANAGGTLRAGMNVQAHLYTGRKVRGTAVPATALLDDGGVSIVFVQKEGESFERRVVESGPRDGDWVAIKSGVAAGERVVTRGAYQVRLAAAQPAAMGHGHAH